MNRRELMKAGLAGCLPVWASKLSLLKLDVGAKQKDGEIIVVERGLQASNMNEFMSRAEGCAHLTIRFPESKFTAEGFVTSMQIDYAAPVVDVGRMASNYMLGGMHDPGEITMTVKLTGFPIVADV